MYLFKLEFSSFPVKNFWILWYLYFQFVKKLHIVAHSYYTNLHSCQQCKRVPFFPHPLQPVLFIDFLLIGILTSGKWYLSVIFICISLIISNVEHLFMFLLAIWCLLWRNVYLGLPPIFDWVGFFVDVELYADIWRNENSYNLLEMM